MDLSPSSELQPAISDYVTSGSPVTDTVAEPSPVADGHEVPHSDAEACEKTETCYYHGVHHPTAPIDPNPLETGESPAGGRDLAQSVLRYVGLGAKPEVPAGAGSDATTPDFAFLLGSEFTPCSNDTREAGERKHWLLHLLCSPRDLHRIAHPQLQPPPAHSPHHKPMCLCCGGRARCSQSRGAVAHVNLAAFDLLF